MRSTSCESRIGDEEGLPDGGLTGDLGKEREGEKCDDNMLGGVKGGGDQSVRHMQEEDVSRVPEEAPALPDLRVGTAVSSQCDVGGDCG